MTMPNESWDDFDDVIAKLAVLAARLRADGRPELAARMVDASREAFAVAKELDAETREPRIFVPEDNWQKLREAVVKARVLSRKQLTHRMHRAGWPTVRIEAVIEVINRLVKERLIRVSRKRCGLPCQVEVLHEHRELAGTG